MSRNLFEDDTFGTEDESLDPAEGNTQEAVEPEGNSEVEELVEETAPEPPTEEARPRVQRPSRAKVSATRTGGTGSVELPTAAQIPGVLTEVGPPLQLQRADPNAKGPWVKYIGVATLRVLGPADWKRLGIKSDDYVQWNVINKKRQPTSRFNQAQLDYLLKYDGRFTLDTSE